ncbi:MAG: deoxyribonuclease IV [Spirochaetales bacterium]|nr:deoxyribonuclease IV [Spirochaetales bacterium]
MKFGFHVSIQGGLSQVPERAAELGCECVQIFSQSPRSWESTPPSEQEVSLFRRGLEQAAISPCVIHTPYLLNLCAEDKKILRRSRTLLAEEMRRAVRIGADYVVVHMGTKKNNSEQQALKLMAQSIDSSLQASGGRRVKLLLENTSGGGGKLGYTFQHLAAVLELSGHRGDLGICLDTAHLFQAGYDIRTRRGLKTAIREFERFVGLEKLFLLHLNDSLTPLGSGHDRHWHIGRGLIGKRAFKRILRHPLLRGLPAIMETPKKNETDDIKNMRMVKKMHERSLLKKIFTGFRATKTTLLDYN